MEIVLLADRPEAAEIVAGWTWNAWGRAAGRPMEAELERVRGFAGRETPPIALVAVEERRVVGSAILRPHEMDEFPDYEHWLSGVFVAPEARGRGIASALAGAVIERTRALGVTRLYLQTEDLTGGLYARLGFEPLDVVDSREARVLVMVATLEAA